MVSVDKAVVARIERSGQRFEIMVDPDLALEFKKGRQVSLDDVLAVQEIYTDAGRGERASEEDLRKAFHTTDPKEAASHIIREGDVQITTEHRRRLVEEKTKKLAGMISARGVDPKTRLPHPPQRIINAMEEAKFHVDFNRKVEDQLEAAVEKISPVLPISIERVEVEVRIPLQHAGRASSEIRNIAQLKKEEWRQDAWVGVIEIPAGMQSGVYTKLNELTSGQAETRVLRKGL